MSYLPDAYPAGNYQNNGGNLAPADKTAVTPPVVLPVLPGARDVPNFNPYHNGLWYSNNDWPHESYVDIRTVIWGIPIEIPVGDASNGMCGGMAYAARDLYEAGRLPPPSPMNPRKDSPAWRYLYKRLLQSFAPPSPTNYVKWMHPSFHAAGAGRNGISWMTINEAMPSLRACIDSGHPCPIGLIRVEADLTQLDKIGMNHQVLAWGYSIVGSTTTVKIYDSNLPRDNSVKIAFDHTKPEQPTTFTHTDGIKVFGFFTTTYSSDDPEPLFYST